MDRRESIKSLFIGAAAGGLALASCKPEISSEAQEAMANGATNYGRTPEEDAQIASLHAQQFFSVHELESLATLTALILPENQDFPSAASVGVPDFIEFMAKDYPAFQTPIRGGLMWLDHTSNRRFGLEFKKLEQGQQHEILEEIAYPDLAVSEGERPLEVRFFSLMRNLTLTGYYTTETGIKDLGYQGNMPNVWDGVPQEVLDQHGVAYEAEWLAKCIDQKTRGNIASWDEQGNLLT